MEHVMALPESGTPRGRGVVLTPGSGREISLGEAGTVTMKLSAESAGGRMSAYEFATPPRTAGPPLHIHRSWDEAFYVLSGEMTFLIDGVTSLAPAGSFVFIPRGVPHTFWNASDAPARQLTVFTPSGIEDYFDEVTGVMAGGGTLAEAIALMEQHDMIVPASEGPAYGAIPHG
jgi:quercetin dioxygenase-like cupin family protein